MTEEMFDAVLDSAGAKRSTDALAELPEGRTITFYVAHDGAAITITRVISVRRRASLVEARDHKGEMFLLALDDIFAASLTAREGQSPARKAGFVG